MRRAGALAAAGLVLLLAGAPAPASASAGPRRESARRGAEWIASLQRADGAFGEGSRAKDVADALLALVAGGVRGAPVERALGAIAARPLDGSEPAGEIGAIVMGIVAGGADPRAFAGTDYVAALDARYNPATGAYEAQMFQNALALLGKLAAGDDLPEGAVRYVRLTQCPSGGWSWQPGCGGVPNVDATSLVIAALAGGGLPPQDETRDRARGFLLDARNEEGGFGESPGAETNANSTGLALAAIAALGEDAERPPWRSGGRDPVAALAALQHASGGYRWKASRDAPDLLATQQAVPGMAGLALPVEPGVVPDPGAPSSAGSAVGPSTPPGAAPRGDRPARPSGPPAPGEPVHPSPETAVLGTRIARGPAPSVPASRALPVALALAAAGGAAAALGMRIRRFRRRG